MVAGTVRTLVSVFTPRFRLNPLWKCSHCPHFEGLIKGDELFLTLKTEVKLGSAPAALSKQPLKFASRGRAWLSTAHLLRSLLSSFLHLSISIPVSIPSLLVRFGLDVRPGRKIIGNLTVPLLPFLHNLQDRHHFLRRELHSMRLWEEFKIIECFLHGGPALDVVLRVRVTVLFYGSVRNWWLFDHLLDHWRILPLGETVPWESRPSWPSAPWTPTQSWPVAATRP